jgi:hypothetical protein
VTMGVTQEREDHYSAPGCARRPLDNAVQVTNVSLTVDKKGLQFFKAMGQFPKQK